ncbi:methyl-accepting chemotaxis protein [Magnetovibrio blakemorei]|uniref:Magnetosome protein MamY n=2 Tax=Pseudomonadota TaxID=1224 RepID=C4RAF9_9PROT|nr:methyl-accepting chemotaxis protein [Magnetovibrio blakemorei]ASN76803.1 MamY [Vibrio sp. MV-1]OEJ67305.1 hypothetical protein BEN30_00285 [Magnetovibrio blakemorei]CAV30804.1 magnetosome protein MamY [Magnetovibrio blakemorei]
MNSIFQDARFQRTVVIPSGIWVLICGVYVSLSIGWGNLSAFLTNELVVLVMGLILPIMLFVMLFGIGRSSIVSEDLAEQVSQQSKKLDDLSVTLGLVSKALEQQSDTIQGTLLNGVEKLEESQRVMSQSGTKELMQLSSAVDRLPGLLKDQGVGINTLTVSLGGLRDKIDRIVAQTATGDNTLDLNEIHQQTALLGFVNTILNDLNVATTRILVRLMESEGRQKHEVKDFIQGLLSAYSVGDRGVFFSVLQHQMANNMERIVGLQAMVGEREDARRDMAKIIREIRQITSLVTKIDDKDMAKTICDITVLESLEKLLGTYFNLDGSSKDTAVY